MIQQRYLFLNNAISNNSYKTFEELTVMDELYTSRTLDHKHIVSSINAMCKLLSLSWKLGKRFTAMNMTLGKGLKEEKENALSVVCVQTLNRITC